jgi:hypothetical protein
VACIIDAECLKRANSPECARIAAETVSALRAELLHF